MITEKQIKARFNKNHLRALVRKMQKEEFYDYHDHKRDEYPSLLYTLRPGVTPELISENVRFKEIKTYENGFSKLYGEWYYINRRTGEGRWQTNDYLRIKRIGEGQYTVIGNYTGNRTDAEKVDMWIKSHLLDHDQWMNNNSAIDIFI